MKKKLVLSALAMSTAVAFGASSNANTMQVTGGAQFVNGACPANCLTPTSNTVFGGVNYPVYTLQAGTQLLAPVYTSAGWLQAGTILQQPMSFIPYGGYLQQPTALNTPAFGSLFQQLPTHGNKHLITVLSEAAKQSKETAFQAPDYNSVLKSYTSDKFVSYMYEALGRLPESGGRIHVGGNAIDVTAQDIQTFFQLAKSKQIYSMLAQ